MTITAAYKATWLAAIDRCLEQETYGNADRCELCQRFYDKWLPNDDVCNGLGLNCCPCHKWLDMNCTGILKNRYPALGKDEKWATEYVRPVLREMRAWIEAQEVVG